MIAFPRSLYLTRLKGLVGVDFLLDRASTARDTHYIFAWVCAEVDSTSPSQTRLGGRSPLGMLVTRVRFPTTTRSGVDLMRDRAVWPARQSHDLEVAGSNPALATRGVAQLDKRHRYQVSQSAGAISQRLEVRDLPPQPCSDRFPMEFSNDRICKARLS